MRTRNLKPGFFDNETLGSGNPLIQLLFAGLWLIADRDGRLEDRPLRIKAKIFPFRSVDADKLLAELASLRDSDGTPFITRYESSGRKVIAVVKFREHQHPHPKEISLGFEPPGPEAANSNGSAANNGGTAGPICPSPTSLTPSPTSLTPSPDSGARGKRSESAEGFDEFWTQYPRKEAKPKAVEAWNHLKPDPTIRAAILGTLSRQKTSDQWSREGGRYIPLPSTYLNQRRWEDEPATAKPGGQRGASKRYNPSQHGGPGNAQGSYAPQPSAEPSGSADAEQGT